MPELIVRFRLATHTKAEWEAKESSCKPLKGELCVYSDIKKAKLGDGSTLLKDLEFLWLSDSEVEELIAELEQGITTKINEVAAQISAHTGNTSNPHNVTKEQVGLGKVENKTSSEILGELTGQHIIDKLGFTPSGSDTKYSVMLGATASSDGVMGLAPAPAAGSQGSFLRGDATWDIIDIADVNGLDAELEGKAPVSHGTHVTYAATEPKIAGTASVGTANTVSRGDHVHPAQTTITGNAGSATKLANARKIELSGDVTGSTTFDGSGDKSIAATLANSGVTAGNYGPSSDDAPGYSGTFEVPYFTVDAKGRVTVAATRTITLPADNSKEYSLSSFGVTASAAELNYMTGVTSGVQTQLNAKVPTTRKINGKALSEDINLSATDVSAIPSSSKGAKSGVAELDENGFVPASQLPSYVDDTVEGYYNSTDGKFYKEESFTTEIAGESGKIYVNINGDSKTFRWSGTTFVEISKSLALGTTSSTAFAGDKGQVAYEHATAKGSAFSSGLYKITTNAHGHVTGATAVQKSDITDLGIPSENTTYSAAGTNLGLVKSGGDVTVTDGVITVNDDSHAHTIANIDGLQSVLDGKAPTSHGTHVTYGSDDPKSAGTASAGTADSVSRSDHVHPAQTTITGNAGTATKLANARNISLSGDVTGSASFDGSGDKTISTTLANSGVTAGSYGPSANGAPGAQGSFLVPYITVDAKGRVTAIASKTITLPAESDENVQADYSDSDANYPILMASDSVSDGDKDHAYYNNEMYANPSTATLGMKNIVASESITVGGATITRDAANSRVVISVP